MRDTVKHESPFRCSDRMCGANDCETCYPGCADIEVIKCDICDLEVDHENNESVIKCEVCNDDICKSCNIGPKCAQCAQCAQDLIDIAKEGNGLYATMWYNGGVCYFRVSNGRTGSEPISNHVSAYEMIRWVKYMLVDTVGLQYDQIEWIGERP